MCGRFVQVIDIELFIKRFGIIRPKEKLIASNYNVAPGDYAYVITNDRPNELQSFQFGLTPSWAKKPMYLINARAEGNLNPQNELNFEGEAGILNKPSFQTAIRSQRCLVIANAFYEGPQKEKLSKPFLIQRKDQEVFTFAGIWDTWVNNQTGEVSNSFSIITTVANEATQLIGHPRSPVILEKKNEKLWLDSNLPIDRVVQLLQPFPGNLLQTEAVSIRVKDPKNKDRDLIIPIEQGSSDHYEIKVTKDLRLEGMGSGKRKDPIQPVQTKLF
jgi:putative SOS response-associated peptidase YedK